MGVDPWPAITLNLHFYLKQLAGVLVSEAVLPAQVQKGVNKNGFMNTLEENGKLSFKCLISSQPKCVPPCHPCHFQVSFRLDWISSLKYDNTLIPRYVFWQGCKKWDDKGRSRQNTPNKLLWDWILECFAADERPNEQLPSSRWVKKVGRSCAEPDWA